jgi:hypothetical protein
MLSSTGYEFLTYLKQLKIRVVYRFLSLTTLIYCIHEYLVLFWLSNYIAFSRFGSRSPLRFRSASLDRFINIVAPLASVNNFVEVFLANCLSSLRR